MISCVVPISRRQFLASLTAAALGAPARPHIVLFVADDHGWDIAGCYGNRVIKTPNIDALAAEGLRFTRAFAGSPTCSPSRAILYTGLHSARNGLMGNHTGTRAGLKSLAHYLKAQGYRTVLANKTHVQPQEVFDFEFLKATLPDAKPKRKYRLEGLDNKMIDAFLAAHDRSQPLFLIIADSSPHVTWEKNREYDPAKIPLPPIVADTPVTRAAMANYYQDITTADRNFGSLAASLKKHGYESSTCLIYTADQGPEWPHSKWTLYDTGLRVPFIVRWPGHVPRGRVTDAMISFVDVTPTLVEIAGGKAPAGIDGSSFVPVLTGKAKKFRNEIYASHSGDGTMNMFPQRAVRDLRYKYILNLHPERRWTTHFTLVDGIPESHKAVYDSWSVNPKLIEKLERHEREELFDTTKDPYELDNIAARADVQPVLAKMRARMKEMRAKLGDVDE